MSLTDHPEYRLAEEGEECDTFLIVPLYDGWLWNKTVTIQGQVMFAHTEEDARKRWHKEHPFGIYGTILSVKRLVEVDG